MLKEEKKWFILAGIALLAAAAIFVSGEDALPYPVKKAEEEKVLSVTIGGGDASWKSCVNEVAAAYMKEHPGVRVKVKTTVNIEHVDYDKGLLIENAKGDFGGIVEMRNAAPYVEEGKLAQIPDELAGQARQVKEIGGKTYSIPRYYSCYGIIYNRELFREFKLEEPQDYEEFLTICETLKQNGVTPLALGAADLWHLDNWVNILFAKNMSGKHPDWISLCRERKVRWTDPEAIQFLTDFKTLFDKGYVNGQYDVTSDAQTIEQLAAGEAAMLCSGTWMFSQIQKVSPDFEIGWFFMPGEGKEDSVKLDGAWGWAITEECRKEGLYDTAVDFLEFYYRPDIYQKVLQSMNGISALKEGPDYEMIPVQQKIAAEAAHFGTVQDSSISTGGAPEGFANQLYLYLLELAGGKRSIQKTAELLDDEWEMGLEEK